MQFSDEINVFKTALYDFDIWINGKLKLKCRKEYQKLIEYN